jgi:hypothetical protein
MSISRNQNFLAVLATLLMGCAANESSIPAFRSLDMSKDLDAATLSRYEQQAGRAPGGSHGHATIIEKTDWWPLGLVAYWKRGTVRAMHAGPEGCEYVVSECKGYGPLSILYASKTQTVYDASGKRKDQMAASSIMWGHLAMFHTMGSQGSSGHWMEHKSSHLFHHLFNYGEDHGGRFFSFFSAPNPIGAGQ